MDGPHAKCSLCYTFLCIVVTPGRIPLSGPAASSRSLYNILELLEPLSAEHKQDSRGLASKIQCLARNTHATELVLDCPGFYWSSYHLLDNSSSHVAD